MKKILLIVGGVIIIAAIVILNVMKKDKGVMVTVEKIEQGSVQAKVTGSGQIKPAVEVKISANVAGKIVKLNAKEGDRVKAGMMLVALDPTQYEAAVERSKSALLSAKANEKKAKSELNRSKELFEKKLVSLADYESAEAAYESAMSTRMQTDAALKEAREALHKTRLYTTMDGVVTKLDKEVGEMAIGAQFQEDVIMVVSDLSKIEAVIEVDENDVINVSIGDSSSIELDAFPDTSFTGVVTKIANSAITVGAGTQEQVTNFEVTVTFDNPDPRFRPGMSATVDIMTQRLDNVIKVPIQAVTVRDEKKLKKKESIEEKNIEKGKEKSASKMNEVVFVVENGKAIAKPVKLGISDDMFYAVLSGLNAGEEVITGPFKILSKSLNDGDLVQIKDKKEGKVNAD
jgi:HlyD family secretion protein